MGAGSGQGSGAGGRPPPPTVLPLPSGCQGPQGTSGLHAMGSGDMSSSAAEKDRLNGGEVCRAARGEPCGDARGEVTLEKGSGVQDRTLSGGVRPPQTGCLTANAREGDAVCGRRASALAAPQELIRAKGSGVLVRNGSRDSDLTGRGSTEAALGRIPLTTSGNG
uniref:Uncharacterized protein n=1 Tax=Alexandrium monilatum TaxID=311494 RepID=A0A7S4UWC0_9DINO|mmetsp:Transcript_104589/g.312392  ORF Transcript_104589/g.312392 Transcript_104589/m.312392 type:complete len:165 (-) Transcript_104589:507-1001(-)